MNVRSGIVEIKLSRSFVVLQSTLSKGQRSHKTMSNIIIHGYDDEWPFEQHEFDPPNPQELPAETYQYVSYTDESGDTDRKRVRYVVRSKWFKAESKLSIEYRAEDQEHLPEGWPSAEDVEFWVGDATFSPSNPARNPVHPFGSMFPVRDRRLDPDGHWNDSPVAKGKTASLRLRYGGSSRDHLETNSWKWTGVAL